MPCQSWPAIPSFFPLLPHPARTSATPKRKRPLRWRPTWFKSYSYIAADTIWNPGHPLHPSDNAMPNLGRGSASLTGMTGALSASNTLERARRQAVYFSRTSIATSLSIHLYLPRDCRQQSVRGNRIRSHQDDFPRKSNFERSRLNFPNSRSSGLYQSYCSVRANVSYSDLADRGSIIAHSLSLPCLFSQDTRFPGSSIALDSSQTTKTAGISSRSPQKLEISRKYQVWSTWMELQQPEHTKLIRPPPGTPQTELLASTSSDQLPISMLIQQAWKGASGSSSANSTKLILLNPSKGRHVDKGRPAENRVHNFTPKARRSAADLHGQLRLQHHSMTSNPYDQALSSSEGGGSSARQKKLVRMHRSDKEFRKDNNQKLNRPLTDKISIQELSNWEIQFIDGLDRKLEWLYNQLSPGRRPYHFAMLANHWLNKETWIVIDPPTRVSIDARRQLGDPRFNVPYPNTDWTPKPKYPKVRRKAAYTPRIDSWRAAVNRNRQVLGLHDIVKVFKLYDDPAGDPPDGKVDPSCWILRKPPQGICMSTRQKQVYYEGGAGWQETLDDWQKVRRGYRIRKAVHEGRANRTRAREIALGISRYYRMVAAKDS
ncbi:hypothetical protein BO94DRAFT_565264 [Aspergillus sclerotioniger CBS 115572]|uniref:Uncharacterized protein n=1 Tax=Aspergillus sclerotioniger CBS 115572 TaxID=1450535 RepID=A0A317WVW5_9EURO|nr:hypothetical protein BO94DRAFT_565264 [Aspergillus sclerotioniger CBS 115572]PWY89442.1 hypothetical protein BO94DRAFT_565264 [Aspergillus sclerotioniger CBS 115572]